MNEKSDAKRESGEAVNQFKAKEEARLQAFQNAKTQREREGQKALEGAMNEKSDAKRESDDKYEKYGKDIKNAQAEVDRLKSDLNDFQQRLEKQHEVFRSQKE